MEVRRGKLTQGRKDDLWGWKNLLGGQRKSWKGLRLLSSDQKNLSAVETKVSQGQRKGLQGLMRVLALRIDLSSGESKGMGRETEFLGGG